MCGRKLGVPKDKNSKQAWLDAYANWSEYDSKTCFISGLNSLLWSCDSRYTYLKSEPMQYTHNPDTDMEYVTFGGKKYNVTGDSLTAMLGDIFGD
jgi:hypothetical protein